MFSILIAKFCHLSASWGTGGGFLWTRPRQIRTDQEKGNLYIQANDVTVLVPCAAVSGKPSRWWVAKWVNPGQARDSLNHISPLYCFVRALQRQPISFVHHTSASTLQNVFMQVIVSAYSDCYYMHNQTSATGMFSRWKRIIKWTLTNVSSLTTWRYWQM